MEMLMTKERLDASAGALVRLFVGSPEWFSVEGVFEEHILLKDFDGNRLTTYKVGEVTLWEIEASELQLRLGSATVEGISLSQDKQKTTRELVVA